jgi:hypothetical protein
VTRDEQPAFGIIRHPCGDKDPAATTQEDIFRAMNESADEAAAVSDAADTEEGDSGRAAGASVGGLVASVAAHDISPIDFLERTSLNAQLSSDKILEIARRVPTPKTAYPKNRLAGDLQLVSRLIAGGLSSRIYYVSLGGFDTHTNQQGAHARLLTEWSQSLAAFLRDMKEQGNADRVLVLTFSEFGRRVEENASAGTDHGAAAPVFLAGGPAHGGLFGQYPSLSPKDLQRGDLVHSVDFRSVYATVLDRWLQISSNEVLGRAFDPVSGLVRRVDG